MHTPAIPTVASFADGGGGTGLGQRVAAPIVSAALAATRPELKTRVREISWADRRLQANFAVRRGFGEFYNMLDLQTPPCLGLSAVVSSEASARCMLECRAIQVESPRSDVQARKAAT